MTGTLARACALFLIVGAGLAHAQTQEELLSDPFYTRFDFGVRAGANVRPHLHDNSFREVTNADADPVEFRSGYGRNQSQAITVGPSVAFRLTDRFGLSADFLYKHIGYDAGDQTGVELVNLFQTQAFTSGAFERTRADVWDITLMVRRYHRPYFVYGPKFFINAGPTFRVVSGVHSFREVLNADANNNIDNTPVKPTNKVSPGVAAGAGVRIRDEIGINLEIEGRYTRWLRHPFDQGVVHGNGNQVEILVGFTF